MKIRHLLNEAAGITAAFAFGRFNPAHQGHIAVWQTVERAGVKWYIGTNPTTIGANDPLTFEQKSAWMQAIYPKITGHIVPETSVMTLAARIFKELGSKEDATIAYITDADDWAWSGKLLNQYNGVEGKHGYYKFAQIVHVPSPRVSSATALRDAARANDKVAFYQASGTDPKLKVAGKTYFDTVKEAVTKYPLPVKKAKKVAEAEKNPHTSALGKALYRDLSKEKKASPAQVQRNKERWAKRQAEREQGVTEDVDRVEAQADYMQGQCMILAVAINQYNPQRYPIGYIWEYNMSAGAPDMQLDDDEWADLSPEEQEEISKDISRHSIVHAYVRDRETNEYIDARGRHRELPNLWGRLGQTRFEEFPGTARELIDITVHGDWDEVGEQVSFKRGQPAFDSLAGPAGVKRALDYAIKYLGVVGPERVSESEQKTVAKTWDQMTPQEKLSGVKGRTVWNERTQRYYTVFDVPVKQTTNEASLATMRDYFAGDKDARDPYEITKQRLYYTKEKDTAQQPTHKKEFKSKWEYEQWLKQNKLTQISGVKEDEEAGEVEKQGQLIPFPAGTTKVAVSDVYDWYKLGQIISDLDDADPSEFGQGAPETVIAFGSEEEEHKLLPLLQRLGLRLKDIDQPVSEMIAAKSLYEMLKKNAQ